MIDGEVQLEGGHHDYDGRVQVCRNGEWNYLCLPSLSDDVWSQRHGRVVCRSLNHSTDSKSSLLHKIVHCYWLLHL